MIYHYSLHTLSLDEFFFKQQTFLCVVDYYNKFQVVCEVHNQTPKELIQIFAKIVGEYGFSKRKVIGSGSNIVSSDFIEFCSALEIKTLTTSSSLQNIKCYKCENRLIHKIRMKSGIT